MLLLATYVTPRSPAPPLLARKRPRWRPIGVVVPRYLPIGGLASDRRAAPWPLLAYGLPHSRLGGSLAPPRLLSASLAIERLIGFSSLVVGIVCF